MNVAKDGNLFHLSSHHLLIHVDTLLSQPSSEPLIYEIVHFPELDQPGVISALKGGRIVEAPMEMILCLEPDTWAILFGVIADSDHNAEMDVAQVLALFIRNLVVDRSASFGHHTDGVRVDPLGLKPGDVRFKTVASVMTQKSLLAD
ncbi:MAG: hypothetical protein WA996_22295 [Candidatus Promineifilaceae bacterium]